MENLSIGMLCRNNDTYIEIIEGIFCLFQFKVEYNLKMKIFLAIKKLNFL